MSVIIDYNDATLAPSGIWQDWIATFTLNYRQSPEWRAACTGATKYTVVTLGGGGEATAAFVDGVSATLTTINSPTYSGAKEQSVDIPDTGFHEVKFTGNCYLHKCIITGGSAAAVAALGLANATKLYFSAIPNYVDTLGWKAFGSSGGAIQTGALVSDDGDANGWNTVRVRAKGKIFVGYKIATAVYVVSDNVLVAGPVALSTPGAEATWGQVYDHGETTTWHDVQILFCSGNGSLVQNVAADAIDTSAITPKKRLLCFGNSVTALTGVTTPTNGYPIQTGLPLRMNFAASGIGFSTTKQFANDSSGAWTQISTRSGEARAAADVLPQNPHVVIFWYAENDREQNGHVLDAANPTETTANLATACLNVWNAVKDGTNLVKFLVVNLLKRNDQLDADTLDWNTNGLGTFVTNAADSRIRVIDTSGLTRGGIHPVDAVHEAAALLFIPEADIEGAVFDSASVPSAGSSIAVQMFDGTDLQTTGTIAAGDFTVGGTTSAVPTSVSVNGATKVVTVNVSPTVKIGETVTIAYTQGANKITDSATPTVHNAASFSAQSVTNGSTQSSATPPVLSTVTVAANGLTWTFDFTSSDPPIAADFPSAGITVNLSGGALTLSFGSFASATQVVYTGSRVVLGTETGNVTYDAGVGDLHDDAGVLATIGGGGKTITNNSTQVDMTDYGNVGATYVDRNGRGVGVSRHVQHVQHLG
jgi:hypothetical protein